MTSEDSPWNTAHLDIIHLLVSHLRRTQRWRRDARSLRALNSHWCSAVNAEIKTVRPHQSRKLSIEDIHSLSKFQNLTYLNAVPFEGDDSSSMDINCLQLAKTLCQLPRLTVLCLDHLMEGIAEANAQMDDMMDDHLHFLSRISSLQFMGKRYGTCQLPVISEMKVKQLTIAYDDSDALTDVLSQMPVLETLNLKSVDGGDASDALISTVASLKRVSLSLSSPLTGLRINEARNLVSLDVHSIAEHDLELLLDLPKLTSLKFSCESSSIFSCPALQSLMKRLVSLNVSSSDTACSLDDGICHSQSLRSLTLQRFRLKKAVLDDLGNRASLQLSLFACTFDADVTFKGGVPSLKVLHFFEDFRRLILQNGRRLSSLQYLKQLVVVLSAVPPDDSHLDQICCLRRLESLTINNAFTSRCSRVEGFKKLQNLPRLSYLSVSKFKTCELIEAFMALEMVTNLEELKMTIRESGSVTTDFILEQSAALRRKAPHLKLTMDLGNYSLPLKMPPY